MQKVTKDFLEDTRTENRNNHSQNGHGQNENKNSNQGNSNNQNNPEVKEGDQAGAKTENPENKDSKTDNQANPENLKNAKENQGSNSTQNTSSNTNQESTGGNSGNDFKEKFDEYFKGAGSIIAGGAITELVDDFKTKLLFIYAKKQGVDVPIETLKMDPKSKEFCSFLIDYAIKNKLFGFIEKYPLVAAGGVVALSGLSSYLFVEMMKKGQEESKAQKKENDDLKAKLKKYENAQTVEPENENEHEENDDTVKNTIANL